MLPAPAACRFVWLLAISAVAMLSSGEHARAASCEPVPAPVRDLDLARPYADAAGTLVDPERVEANKDATMPLILFIRTVTMQADRAIERGDGAAARCGLDWLTVWARGEAWLGRVTTAQAEYQRKWDLAGVAAAYLKLRSFADAEQRAAIEPWLIRLADATRAWFDNPRHKRNNHWYWVGLGQAAVAIAAGSERHWQAARSIMADAARDIAADGTLAMELERKQRALHYHVFSVTPLAVMAELARWRGEDWYALGGGALHRLVAATANGLEDPATFGRLAGVEQERSTSPGAGWLPLYRLANPGRLDDVTVIMPTKHRWLGGDVTLLVRSEGNWPRPR